MLRPSASRPARLSWALKPAKEPMKFNPPPDTVIRAGDYLIVIADDVGLKKLEAVASSSRA